MNQVSDGIYRFQVGEGEEAPRLRSWMEDKVACYYQISLLLHIQVLFR